MPNIFITRTFRSIAFVVIAILIAQLSFSQTNKVWVRYTDAKTDLDGYKDLKGNIKVHAKFESPTRADSFYNIIAVTETKDSSFKSYYLLKNGREVGQDSVYSFDFTFDCESEEKILFRDWKKNRVGFFSKNGVVIIPAIYNYASPFHNGLSVAYINGRKKCWGRNEDTTNCEHWGWVGGERILINDQNEILVNSFDINTSNINWYSERINDLSVDTSLYVSIKGRNGITYSFLDYEKEFMKWFYSIFLPSLALKEKSNLKSHCFPEITYWSEKYGWKSIGKEKFFKTFPIAITKERFQLNKLKEISIGQEDLNYLIFTGNRYRKYFNACGEHNKERYPLFDVMLTYYQKRTKQLPDTLKNKLSNFYKEYEITYQEHLEFLRTERGYKLLDVSLKK